MSSILFDVTYLFEVLDKPQVSWNNGTIRYAREISLGLDAQRVQKCSYVLAEENKEELNILKEMLAFPLWEGKLTKDIQRDSICFFPSINSSFPKELEDNSNSHLFVTIYDLIPLLHPNYCHSEFVSRFKKTLQSYVNEERMHYFCISEHTKKDLCNLKGINPKKVTVTPLAADKEKFYVCRDEERIKKVRKSYKIGNSPYFLYLSHFEKRKNHILLLQAFSLFIKRYPDSEVKLVLVGSGFDINLVKFFMEFILKEKLEKHIHISWSIEEEDLAPLMSDCLSFLYPSLYEGFGLPALEAMQCGAPVIASNTSSIPEVVGDAGILLSPDDVVSWMQAMGRIYESKDLRKDLSERSLKRASLFSWKKTVSKMLEAFNCKKKTCSNV
jgi:glycosyltransferase involved in cell wall biosynthesis